MTGPTSDVRRSDGVAALSTPVILPIEGRAGDAWNRRQDAVCAEKNRVLRAAAADALQRFTFPELAATAADSGPDSDAASHAKTSCEVAWPSGGGPAVAQACAELAAAICWRLASNRSTVLALTSPGDGDGKTGAVVALAPELAQRTPGGILVVDADFRTAGLSRRLRVSETTETVGRKDLIYPTDRPHLHVRTLPQGPLDTKTFADHFAEWRNRWPLVLLDASSLEHAEPSPILRCCDGVYLVVRLGHTARRAVTEAAEAIRIRGGRLLGCVVVGESAGA